jgi:hypothetical protein
MNERLRRQEPMHKYSSKMTDQHRVYVIKRLAAHHTALSIVQGLKQEFGITVTQQAVDHYHPARGPRARLAQRWKDLFWKERRAYISRTANLGLTNKPARIRRREEMMHREWAAGRNARANVILDSIAKDTGDAFGKTKRG